MMIYRCNPKRLRLYFPSAAARNYGLASSMIKPWRFCAVVLSASAAFSLAADESPAHVPDVEIHGPNVRPEQNYAAAQYNLGFRTWRRRGGGSGRGLQVAVAGGEARR